MSYPVFENCKPNTGWRLQYTLWLLKQKKPKSRLNQKFKLSAAERYASAVNWFFKQEGITTHDILTGDPISKLGYTGIDTEGCTLRKQAIHHFRKWVKKIQPKDQKKAIIQAQRLAKKELLKRKDLKEDDEAVVFIVFKGEIIKRTACYENGKFTIYKPKAGI